MKPVPSFNEEFSAEAYYIPGDLNNKRKGTFYVNLRDILEQIKKGESEKLLNQFTKSKPVTSYQSNSNFTKLKSKVKKIISVIRE